MFLKLEVPSAKMSAARSILKAEPVAPPPEVVSRLPWQKGTEPGITVLPVPYRVRTWLPGAGVSFATERTR